MTSPLWSGVIPPSKTRTATYCFSEIIPDPPLQLPGNPTVCYCTENEGTPYEAQTNDSRFPVGTYILVADVSAGSGHLKTAMVNVLVRHESEDDHTPVEISMACAAVNLVADGVVVKPENPSSCRGRAGETGPGAYLIFTLPTAELRTIILDLPAIVIRAADAATTVSPPVSIAYYEKSKRVSATFH